MNRPKLSVVIPCYNEEACLDMLHARVSAAAKAAVGDDHEIILVNDGSRDESWQVMQRLSGKDPRLVAVNLSRNHGHQLALTAGLDLCSGDEILIIDADLQDPPELLAEMRARMAEEDADVVYAVRRKRDGESIFKLATAAAFYRVLDKVTDTPIPLDTGDFRLMSRRALDAFLALPEQARFIRGMVAWIGFRQVPFVYDRQERHAGESKYPLSKMIRFALDAVTGFSTAPLRFASHAGLALTGASALLVLYIAVGWLLGRAIPGWTSLMLVVVVLGAVQMFVLGMIGEYLGRLYVESKRRPLYIVADIAGPVRGHARLGYRFEDTAEAQEFAETPVPSPAPRRRAPPGPRLADRRSERDQRQPRRQRHAADQVALDREHALEDRVDRPGGRRIVAVVLARQPAREARRHRRGEEQGIEISQLAPAQPRRGQRVLQRGLRIAALVVVHHVVRAPHPLMRGHGDQDLAAGLEHPRDRLQRGDIVLDMLDHVEHRDQIVAGGRDAAELGQRRRSDRPAQPLAGYGARGIVDLDRVDPAEGGEHRQVVPGAAADLEDARVAGQAAPAREIVGEDVAARAIPPMGGIMRRHPVIDDAVHQDSLAISRTPSGD